MLIQNATLSTGTNLIGQPIRSSGGPGLFHSFRILLLNPDFHSQLSWTVDCFQFSSLKICESRPVKLNLPDNKQRQIKQQKR